LQEEHRADHQQPTKDNSNKFLVNQSLVDGPPSEGGDGHSWQ
jgi:hypothetical protein